MDVWCVRFWTDSADYWMGGAVIAAPDEETAIKLSGDGWEPDDSRVTRMQGVTATGEPRVLYYDSTR